jgi:hypothetical protein
VSSAGKRKRNRALADYELVLHKTDGEPLDAYARAHDVSSGGFRAETRSPLAEGQEVAFDLVLDEGDVVRGRARVTWVAANSRGSFSAGTKITRLSWKDGRRLRGALAEQGYDFVQLARKMAWALYWIIVAVGVHNLLFHQALTLAVMGKLIPVIVALIVAGWAILTLLG